MNACSLLYALLLVRWKVGDRLVDSDSKVLMFIA